MKPRGLSAGETFAWLCDTKAYFPREEWITGYVKSEGSTADTLTKTVSEGKKHNKLLGNYMNEVQADLA